MEDSDPFIWKLISHLMAAIAGGALTLIAKVKVDAKRGNTTTSSIKQVGNIVGGDMAGRDVKK